MILLYNILNIIFFPLYGLIILIRIIIGKENAYSALQRLGVRPKKIAFKLADENKKLVWIHAASVGESMAALTLVRELGEIYSNINFLITTGTLSSAKILHKALPENAQHCFVPIDNFFIVRSFLKYWQPNLGIFIESELWPCLISESAKRFDLISVNARLSDRSYARWLGRRKLFNIIVDNFKLVATQSQADEDKYHNLGCKKAINLGNLKFANQELEVNQEELVKLHNILKNKAVFVASSTHIEDEKIILDIIKDFKENTNLSLNYYPIIILRHPERRDNISKKCQEMGLSFSLRSQNDKPSLEQDLYIVDSFGELGLFYKLSYIAFIGGSFKRGGHNLIEPAYFDNVIILGPDMSNFQNIASDMTKQKAAIQISDQAELAEKILFFLNEKNKAQAEEFINNALNFVENRRQTIDNYIKEISKFL